MTTRALYEQFEQRREAAEEERRTAHGNAARWASQRMQNVMATLAECRYLSEVYLEGSEREVALRNVAALKVYLLPAIALYEQAEEVAMKGTP